MKPFPALRMAAAACSLAAAVGYSGSAAPGAGSPGLAAVQLPQDVREAVSAEGRAVVHVLLRGRRPLPPHATPDVERAFLDEVASAQAEFRAHAPRLGVRILAQHTYVSGLAAEVDSSGLEALARMPQVAKIYLDAPVHATLAQGGPLIGAPQVHASGSTGAGMTIAILDTGIDYTHSALGGCFGAGCKVVAGHDFVNNDANPMDDEGHGTSVAGIAAGDSASVPGIAPDAGLAAVKVLNNLGSGSFATVDSGLNWVLANRVTYGIRVVNMSLGDGVQHPSSFSGVCASSSTQILIDSLVANGIAVTVSSGNEGFDAGVSFPACVQTATAIGGVYDASLGGVSWCGNSSCTTILCTDNPTFADKFVCHTSAGPPLDLLAPDYATTTSKLGGGTRTFGGTSAAAPYAAGGFALMFGVAPGTAVATIESNLKSTGVLVVNPDSGQSYPRIDLAAAAMNFDADLDGVADAADNCVSVANPGQEDGDLDGAGDACDNCPSVYNDTQADADGDPSGDACDCDSANPDVYVGAPEVCDGVNNDCASPTWPALDTESDDDMDGQAECAGDCDDANPTIGAGFTELCDGLDNDCNGTVPSNESDNDMDGWRICEGDCNDFVGSQYPGHPEICDGRDNDCVNGVPADEADSDSDGFMICEGDCDDTRSGVNPLAAEICDGLDDDCANGIPLDEADDDSDGVMICEGDCDDSDGAVYPGSPEICDGRNNDCDSPVWPSLSVESDDDMDGAAECAGDCDDADPTRAPGFAEICDERDNDCDGAVDPGTPFLVDTPFLDAAWDPNADTSDTAGAAIEEIPDITGDGVMDIAVGAPGWPTGTKKGSVLLFSGADRSYIRRLTDPLGASQARLGSSLASPGDVNGDGVADIAAGAPYQNIALGLAKGRVVMFSGATGAKLWAYEDPLVPEGGHVGTALAALGDMNADGVPDLITTSTFHCAPGPDCSGEASIVSGATGLRIREVYDGLDQAGEEFGTAATGLGDLDGDGVDDVAVSAPKKTISGQSQAGQILVFSGGTGTLLKAIADPSPGAGNLLGASLAAADVDHDGKLEVIAGSPGSTVSGQAGAGQVLVFEPLSAALLLRLADPSPAAGDALGTSVAWARDVDADTRADILAGAPFADSIAGADSGAALLFSGASGAFLARFTKPVEAANDQVGAAVASIPSLDADEIPEILSGVPRDDAAGPADSGSFQVHAPLIFGDCDGDAIRNSLDDCTDADGDGFGSAQFFPPACPADCDDEHQDTHPGAAQVCDGYNNDCDDPSWPAVPADECFAVDNLRVSDASGTTQLDWDAPAGGAAAYRIYRGDRGDLLAGIAGGLCHSTEATNAAAFADPVATGTMVFYIVAGVRAGVEGSRGVNDLGLEREHSNVCP